MVADGQGRKMALATSFVLECRLRARCLSGKPSEKNKSSPLGVQAFSRSLLPGRLPGLWACLLTRSGAVPCGF